MEDWLSKEHYCYKIHTLLVKTSAYLFFYRQPPPYPQPTPIWLYRLHPIFKRKSWFPLKNCLENPNSPISKGGGEGSWGREGGGGGHTMNITYDLLKQFYNGEMDEDHVLVWSTIQTCRKENGHNREDIRQLVRLSLWTIGMLRQVILCKQKERRWPTRDQHLANSKNETAMC